MHEHAHRLDEPPAHDSVNCVCLFPLRVEKASRNGAARTHCARCGKPVPLRLSTGPVWR